MLDLLIKNGLICDGTGQRPFVGDVAVKDGKIAEIAPAISAQAAQVLDAEGLVVSPAFIDMHSHSDDSFLDDDRCQAKIYQGVATEVAGQCGSSLFPRSQPELTRIKEEHEKGQADKSQLFESASFGKLLKKVEDAGERMSTNLVQLVGHNAIRRGVVGLAGRPSGPDERKLSAYLLEQSLEQGAWGLSLGLEYMPGIFSDMEELVELGHVCQRHGVVITSHMRDEGDRLYESVDEMIELGRRTGAHVHIAHLMLSAPCVWGQAEKLYAKLAQARESGVNITADMYPYNACSTGITNTLPEWAMEGGADGAWKRITTPGEDYDRIYQHFCQVYPTAQEGERIYIVSTYGRCPEADDKTVGELSRQWGLSVPDAMVKVLGETQCRANCIFFNMHEDDVFYLLAQDLAIGSDGSGKPFDPAMNQGKPHPRNFGTFPRFLRLRREKNLCPLETAVHRITKKTADIVGLRDRGVLAPGMVADITIFDEATVADTATFKDPFQKPVGIKHVIMDGQFAIKDGQQTENRLGKYLIK